MTEQRINTVRDLLKFIEALPENSRRLYRGQSVDKPLLPRFAREAKARRLHNPVEAERSLIDSFARLSIPFLSSGRPQDNYELLAIAQHYGVPTRLLDWTGNPLFGLWFAVRENPSGDEEGGAFWVLDVQPDHLIPSEKRNTDLFELKRTSVFRPAHVTQRIVAQDGWFTAHWYIERKSKFIALDEQPRFKRHLRKAFIPLSRFEPLRTELRRLGIRDTVLFPELPTLCTELVNDFFLGLETE
jgi:hypothetical protein